MAVLITLISLGVLGLVLYLIEKCKNYSLKGVLLKFIISLLFVSVAIYSSYAKSGHVMSALIIIGLILGLSGDVWLDLKYVYPKDDKVYTYAGFIVFGLGHVLFITGMCLEFFHDANPLYIIIPIVASLIFGIINQLLAKPLKLKFNDLTWIVYVYSVLLFTTPLMALSLSILNNWTSTTLIMFIVGGVLFAISDIVLSTTYFGEGHEKPIDFILNYVTYYSAQFVIATSLFFL